MIAWKRGKITMSPRSRPNEIDAYIGHPFAIFKSNTGWRLAHVPLGCEVHSDFHTPTLKAAKETAERLHELNIDWEANKESDFNLGYGFREAVRKALQLC